MKRAFILTNGGHITSALVADDKPSALNFGDRICVSRPLDLGYAAQIKTGELGTIDFVDALTGSAEVMMDAYHRGLHEHHNHILLVPFDTDDIISGIVCIAGAALRRSVA